MYKSKDVVREKKKKMQAFQSFLTKNDEPKALDLNRSSLTHMSENDEKLEEGPPMTGCCVCGTELNDRKKIW